MKPLHEDVLVEEEIDLADELADIGHDAYLLVYNDDVNSFDWVINCFTEILDHTLDQAEQLAHIIHFKGKATVKTATFSVLKPKWEALCDRGLSAVIEGGDDSDK